MGIYIAQIEHISNTLENLTQTSKVIVANDLKRLISDQGLDNNSRHDALKKLILVDQEGAAEIIVNEYIKPTNDDSLRVDLKERLIEIFDDNQELKEIHIKKIKSLAENSINGLIQKLLDGINSPLTNKSCLKKTAENSPMTTPTALGLYGVSAITGGVLLIGQSQTALNDENSANNAEGHMKFGLGMSLIGIGALLMTESGRQVYRSNYPVVPESNA